MRQASNPLIVKHSGLAFIFSIFFLILFQSAAFSGTVDNATFSPENSVIKTGTSQEITFSAVNDKPAPLQDYYIKIIYDEGLTAANLIVSPPAVKAVIYPGRNLIILKWENIPSSTELKATFSVTSDTEGTYTIRPRRIVFHDNNGDRYLGTCNTATIIARTEIAPPAISNITVSNITTDSATISWTTDQPSSILFEYGTTLSYGSSITDSTQTTNHTITLTGLAPAATYHFRITSTNNYGSSITSGDNTFTTQTPPSPITLTITSPIDGAAISGIDVMVTGTVTNTTGSETGITVNGIIANVYGNEFVANNVPLTEGANTITATAKDANKNTATASLTVNAATTGNYIKITSNTESGIAPLEATLVISGYASGTTPSLSYLGPASVDWTNCTSYDACKVKMTIEGIYYFTATGTTGDGNTSTDTIAITALNQAEMDNLLKGKWEGMRAGLTNADVEKAVGFFEESSQETYGTQFTALTSLLSTIANDMGKINLVKVEGNRAEYEIITTRNGVSYSFHLFFVKDKDGLWKIKVF